MSKLAHATAALALLRWELYGSEPWFPLSWVVFFLLIFAHSERLVAQESSTGDATVQRQTTSQQLQRLMQGLERTEAALGSFSVTTHFIVRRETVATKVPHAGVVSPNTDFTQRVDLDVATGRGYIKVTGKSFKKRDDGTEFTEEFEFESAYDGKYGRTVRSTQRSDGRVDRSARIDTHLSWMQISPLDFTVCHQGRKISEILKTDGARWIGNQTWDGRNVQVVETDPVVNNSEFKAEFWVDPGRGYSVVRRRNLMRRSANDEWNAYYEVDSFDHREVAPGIWLPNKVRTQTECDQVTGRNSHWVVNQPIPERRFQLEFPDGIRVEGLREVLMADVKKSTNYFVAPVTTDLQKHLLQSSEVVAYAALDATAFIDLHTEKIHTDRFDFAGFCQALRTVRGQAGTGTLQIRVNYGNLLPQGFASRFVKHALTGLGRKAGFEEVQVYERHHGAEYTWKGLDATNEGAGQEQAQGDATVQVYPVTTPLSRHLLDDVDCLVELTGTNSLDSPLLTADQKILIRTADARFDLPKKTCVSLFAIMEMPIGIERNDLHDLPQVKQGAEYHRPAVTLLKDLGFREVRIQLQLDATSFQSTYR